MKATLFTLFTTLLIVGCGEHDLSDPDVVEDVIADAVDWSKLQDRSGVTYLQNTEEPFSNYAKRAYENEQVEILAQFKDGHVVRVKQWQENGTPRWDISLKEGEVGIRSVPWGSRPNVRPGIAHGPATIWYENGQKQGEGNWKDGKQDGLVTEWYENGQKKREANLEDGKMDGLATKWHENGQKSFEGNYKDGKKVGLVNGWYRNGQKQREENCKEDKLMSAKVWKPNGEKCPETNVKDGNGVLVGYTEDGTEAHRMTFKDGEYVSD